MNASLPQILDRIRETHRAITPKLEARVRVFSPTAEFTEEQIAKFYGEFHKLFIEFLTEARLEDLRPEIRRVCEASARTRLNGDAFLRLMFEINQSQKKALIKNPPCCEADLPPIFMEMDRFFQAVMEEFTAARSEHWRRRAREALKLHSDFFMNLPFPALTGSAEMVIREINPAVTQVLFSEPGPVGRRLDDWLVQLGVARPRVEQLMARLFRQDILVQQDLEAACPITHKPIYLSLTVNLLRDLDHEIIGFEAVVQDITRIKRLERQATEQMAQLGAVFYSTPVGLIFVDSERVIQRINHYVCDLLGFPPPDQIEGGDMTSFAGTVQDNFKEAEEFLRLVDEIHGDPQASREGELDLASARVTRYMVSPVLDADESPIGWLWIFVDITESKAIDRLRRDLTHMMIHDLKNPLTAIRGAAYVLKPHALSAGRSATDALDLLGRNCDRMMAMIMNLLDIERLESGKLELILDETTPRKLASGVIANQRLAAGSRRLDLEFGPGAEEAAAQVDINLIERALMNLIGNAIKHTRSDGHLIVRVMTPKVGRLRVEVIDDGEGIAPEHHQKIFEKFGQAELRKDGRKTDTGLGLTFCKLAIEAHHGEIGVTSRPGKGATFHFEIPLRQE